MAVCCEFRSAAVRKCPNSADCNKNGIVAFAASKYVALYNINTTCEAKAGLFKTLSGHEAPVHCVKWVLGCAASQQDYLASGSEDGKIIWWRPSSSGDDWVVESTIAAHTSIVHCLDVIYTSDGGILLASCSSDNHMRIFFKANGETAWTNIGFVNFGSGFALAVSLCLLPHTSTPLVAIGGDNSRINLYTIDISKDNGALTQVASLQGHEDWVRALSFAHLTPDCLTLASGSQDTFIRLWTIEQTSVAPESSLTIAQKAEAQLVQQVFVIGHDTSTPVSFNVKFDALLVGHDDFVYSTRWHPPCDSFQRPCLLSASMDKTMIVWTPDSESGIWVECARVGEVGGNTLGLYGGVFGPRGESIIAHGYQGAFHVWTSQDPAAPGPAPDATRRHWQPQVAISGHFGAVCDLDWDPLGSYLITASEDQTTRIFAQRHVGAEVGAGTAAGGGVPSAGTWHELARPQVHGYDMQCVACVSSTMFVSGADEKVLRVFEAPATFLDSFRNVTDTALPAPARAPLGASVPALGLSNKAVFSETLASTVISRPDTNDRLENAVLPFAPATLETPPLEEHLLQNTLWPEVRKLYGHGYELLCVAANHAGTLIASAAKATRPEHSAIRLWAVGDWSPAGVLEGHALSVTQLAFSHNDEWLLSGSRDRQWCLYRRATVGCDHQAYVPACALPKAHERIIWSVGWAPDDTMFVTASRDKTAKVWTRQPAPTVVAAGVGTDDATAAANESQTWGLLATVCTAVESITAIAFLPVTLGGCQVLAVGLETGSISLYKSSSDGTQWQCVATLAVEESHAAEVTRLKWSPRVEQGHARLASCGRDTFVRVYRVDLAAL